LRLKTQSHFHNSLLMIILWGLSLKRSSLKAILIIITFWGSSLKRSSLKAILIIITLLLIITLWGSKPQTNNNNKTLRLELSLESQSNNNNKSLRLEPLRLHLYTLIYSLYAYKHARSSGRQTRINLYKNDIFLHAYKNIQVFWEAPSIAVLILFRSVILSVFNRVNECYDHSG